MSDLAGSNAVSSSPSRGSGFTQLETRNSKLETRIGINAQKLLTSQSYHSAGIRRYLFNLLQEIRALDAPEHYLAYLSDAHIPSELSQTDRFTLRPSRWPTASPSMRVLWEQLRLPRILRHDRITLFHGAVNALPLAWRGPSVVTIFDLTFLRLPGAFGWSNRTYLRSMVRVAARRAERIIAISEATRRDVIRLLQVAPEKVVTVYCGVEPRYQPLADSGIAELREQYGLPDRFILYLGTIEPRKNLIRLVDAYAALRRQKVTDWPLVLVGGRGWGYEAVLDRVTRSGVADAIRMVGFVPDHEMPLWYNAAALFVYPSEYEGFGLPALEALACGTPSIVSNRSSLPEVAGNAAVLVDPTDVQAIANGMERVLEDASLRSRLAYEGPRQASRFTWRRMAEETVSIYRSVITHP